MHLLVAQAGAAQAPDEAVDLGQDSAEVVVATMADTEIAVLAAARAAMGDPPTLRLANIAALSHPMSVDVWAERTVAHSKVLVVRVLGGHAYWSYGLEKLHEVALANGVAFCALPGDAKPDPSLDRFSTIDTSLRDGLWACLAEGGPDNAERFLAATRALARGEAVEPPEPLPLVPAGLWGAATLDDMRRDWMPDAPVAAVTFYRALVQAGNVEVVSALCEALRGRGLNPLPIFVSSLKDEVSQAVIRHAFAEAPTDVVVNMTGFAISPVEGGDGTVLDEGGAMVLQAVLSGDTRETWEQGTRGLGARDLAMNVALPEIDGRVLSRAVAFKDPSRFDADVQANVVRHAPVPDRVAFVADLAAAWSRLRNTPAPDRKVALVLANYPNRDGRIGNGVGLDTPAGTATVLEALARAGYEVADAPSDGETLLTHLLEGPTNAATDGREIRETLSLKDYSAFLTSLPARLRDEITERWGRPENDPFFLIDRKAFALPLARFGNVTVGVQPARGYNIDPKETYHAPDLVPPHGYLAFYAWLRRASHAVVHMGKHGNMEWLPGKALGLSETCWPEAVFGPTPHLYPFIVNDPGEGSQAKRRSQAVIIDHLTPPLTRAETYGPLRQLEALVDEYFEAAGVDPRRLRLLKRDILDLVRTTGLDEDAGIGSDDLDEDALAKLDTYLCELKEMQIRDGLHIFGRAPEGRLLSDLAVALARVPRGLGEGGDASLHRTIAVDLGLDLDPLDCAMGEPWTGARPEALADVSDDPWRTFGDTVERIELLAARVVSGDAEAPGLTSTAVMAQVRESIRPSVEACGDAEIAAVLRGLDGRFVPPGPSGAPTRGRADVLPTGRNFFSVDCRAVPTPAAWELGRKSAELLLKRHMQEHGDWLAAIGLSVWGTSNMRTGGDDIAQAMALIGVEPVWDHASRRVTGFNVVPPAKLGRPRVDVTLRVSGFFRDAFPAQMELFDRAVRAVADLDEDEEDNPVRARVRSEARMLEADGASPDAAKRRATYRIFGSKPGAYGAGLQALIDEKGWSRRDDLADAFIAWGGYAYGAGHDGETEHEGFRERLGRMEAVVHNQDNREHDLLDSDDYYQFEGGMTAAVEAASGARPHVYHNDHSRPERPVVRTLEEEIARVVHARVVNPKWITGVMRHGYKGAFEMAATVDYLFAFAATTGAVRDHHFDAVHAAYLEDETVRNFMESSNSNVLREIADRLLEAQERGLWRARSNSARALLEDISGRVPV